MITRHQDWASRLVEYLTSVADTAGQIGAHDCALFTAGAVQAMTGWEPPQKLLRYQSEAEGLEALGAAGFDSVEAFVTAHFSPVPVLSARAGDIILARLAGENVLGIHQGEAAYVASGRGVATVPLARVTAAWRV